MKCKWILPVVLAVCLCCTGCVKEEGSGGESSGTVTEPTVQSTAAAGKPTGEGWTDEVPGAATEPPLELQPLETDPTEAPAPTAAAGDETGKPTKAPATTTAVPKETAGTGNDEILLPFVPAG